ncbi:MAG: DUF1501 domain-containing protein [Pirellulaceae bacterium]
MKTEKYACGRLDHVHRRTLLKGLGFAGISWLTPLAQALAQQDEHSKQQRPKSVILLWMDGGPSQLETFDPQPNQTIAAGTAAISTAAKRISLAQGMEHLAAEMQDVALVRSVVSKEGDHERAIYNVRTGYRPDPTLVHPSLGAILCHQLPVGSTEIPRHISILPGGSPSRGGYLGDEFDAFKTYDPQHGLPDMKARVDDDRQQQRTEDLDVLERTFATKRLAKLEETRTLHMHTIRNAQRMMTSEQLAAFDLSQVSEREKTPFGDTEFGRGCLAAARLTEVGVRCVEVTLSGWDSHVNNHGIHDSLKKVLDPAFAALIRYLRDRDQLENTLVLCGGEFGRTPHMNPAGGRDHWPHGFSIALAGGNVVGGQAIGGSHADGRKVKLDEGIPIENIHATILNSLGVQANLELQTPIGRPIKLSEGKIIAGLMRT